MPWQVKFVLHQRKPPTDTSASASDDVVPSAAVQRKHRAAINGLQQVDRGALGCRVGVIRAYLSQATCVTFTGGRSNLAAGSLTTTSDLLTRPQQPSTKAERLRCGSSIRMPSGPGWRSLRSPELSPNPGRIDQGWVGLERGQVDRQVVSNDEDRVQESGDGERPEHRGEPGPRPAEGARQTGSNMCIQRLSMTKAQPAVSISPLQPTRFGVQSRDHADRRSRGHHWGSSDWPPRASLHVPLL
ncbi:MAG: hypothetical protein QOK18_3938 [Mycobacterium sp.]|nr:hypothetical protein [Mycobacterium sp.]